MSERTELTALLPVPSQDVLTELLRQGSQQMFAQAIAAAWLDTPRHRGQSLRTLAALVRALPTKKRQGDGWVTPGLKVHAGE